MRPVWILSSFCAKNETLQSFSANFHFEYEQLAADLSARLVESISEQKDLASDPECRPVLREILDTFVEAGWAGAQQLCFRLHEIYE